MNDKVYISDLYRCYRQSMVLSLLQICRYSFKGKKKNLVWNLKDLDYLVILSRFLLSWSIRQDSVHLELHTRFFLREKEKDSCLNFKANKNLTWSTKKNKNLERTGPRTSTSGTGSFSTNNENETNSFVIISFRRKTTTNYYSYVFNN
jgi:hypothetical protein